jgi:hypothetical protein
MKMMYESGLGRDVFEKTVDGVDSVNVYIALPVTFRLRMN